MPVYGFAVHNLRNMLIYRRFAMARTSKSRKSRSRQGAGKAARSSTAQPARQSRGKAALVFTGRNYLLMAAGVVLIVFGYVIMRMENEVDGFISLYVAPLLILGGYLEIIYAILWRPNEKSEAETT